MPPSGSALTAAQFGYPALPIDDEHPALSASVRASSEVLRSLRSNLVAAEGGSAWKHHYEYADRGRFLGDHLDSALSLARVDRFASAFSSLRTAMEHQVVDRLLFLGSRYRQRFRRMPSDQFDEWQADISAGVEWSRNVVSLERDRDDAVLIRRGHDVRGVDGTVAETVSPYWRVLERHRPMLGPPSIQEDFYDGLGDLEDRKRWAKANRDTYSQYLRWGSLLDNLELNELIPPSERVRLEVHYRFLSMFTHATKAGYDIIERGLGPIGQGRPGSHCLSELVLLYCSAISRCQLLAFCEFVDQRPHLIQLDDRSTVDEAVRLSREQSAHLWYLGDEPTEYDRFEEANRRVWLGLDPSHMTPVDRTPPSAIAPADVRYYDDPLDRLHKLHLGASELTTGFGYSALWP